MLEKELNKWWTDLRNYLEANDSERTGHRIVPVRFSVEPVFLNLRMAGPYLESLRNPTKFHEGARKPTMPLSVMFGAERDSPTLDSDWYDVVAPRPGEPFAHSFERLTSLFFFSLSDPKPTMPILEVDEQSKLETRFLQLKALAYDYYLDALKHQRVEDLAPPFMVKITGHGIETAKTLYGIKEELFLGHDPWRDLNYYASQFADLWWDNVAIDTTPTTVDCLEIPDAKPEEYDSNRIYKVSLEMPR